LAVTHLALVTRYGCSIGRSSHRMSWIDQALIDMEPHLLVRHRKPVLILESSQREKNSKGKTGNIHATYVVCSSTAYFITNMNEKQIFIT